MVTASAAIMVSLLTSCARASAGLLIGLREEKQSAGVLLGGFDECHKLDCSACVAHQLSGERSVDGSGPQLVATGVKRFGCSPAMESSRHRAFDPPTGVRQPGNDYEPRDGPLMGPGGSLWVSVWRIPRHDVTALGRAACGPASPSNGPSLGSQECSPAWQ
jgi:hypothetical protein